MDPLRRRISVYLVALALSLPGFMLPEAAAAQRTSQGPSELEMAVDGLVIRPIGLVATVVGGVVFVATLPFSMLGGNAGDAKDALVVEPARFTFKRPLGEFGR